MNARGVAKAGAWLLIFAAPLIWAAGIGPMAAIYAMSGTTTGHAIAFREVAGLLVTIIAHVTLGAFILHKLKSEQPLNSSAYATSSKG